MYPGHHAETSPDKAAAISARTGEVVTYAELDARSNRLAQLLWAEGLRRGDHLAVFLENHLRYFEVAWAALRSGLYLTTVNRYLTAPEAGYIVDDCGAQVLVSSRAVHEAASGIPGLVIVLSSFDVIFTSSSVSSNSTFSSLSIKSFSLFLISFMCISEST